MKKSRRGEQGFTLAVVVMAMVLIALLIPLLHKSTERNTKWAVDQKHSSVALQLASAGIERALWKLKETNNNWDYLLTTGPIAGYNNDVDYTDVNEDDGVYRISISSTSNKDQMILVATARDTKSSVYKAAQAYAVRTQIGAPLHGHNIVNSASTAGDFTVHWGPIYATGDLTLNTESINQYYPRKYAGGSISTFSANGVYGDRDLSPSSPNSDNLEYYAYTTVPPIVTPDFDFYRASASALGTYYTSNQTFTSLVTDPGQVYFFEGDAQLRGADSFFQGLLIVMGKCTLKGNNDTGSAGPNNNDYSVTPDTDVYLEYQKNVPIRKSSAPVDIQGNTAATDEYPGDDGVDGVVKAFQFGTTNGGASGKKVSVKGFMYCGTELTGGNTNAQVIHGAVALSKTASITSGKFEIFYDPTLSIRTAASEIYLSDWKEIAPTPF